MHRHEITAHELATPLAIPADATLLATMVPIWWDLDNRPAYHFITQDNHHVRVTLHGQHVADARRCPEGGWSLFGAKVPELAIAWAGSSGAIRLTVHEALTLQADAAPGHYGWFRLHRQHLEYYRRPLHLVAA